MKNVLNLLKPTTFLLLLFVAFASVSCSKNDETPPDPRAEFVGSFEMEEYEVFVGILDTSYTVTGHPKIRFIFGEDLSKDELEIKLEDFIETTVKGLSTISGTSLEIAFENETIDVVEITENEFFVKDFNCTGTISNGSIAEKFIIDFDADGKIDEEKLTMDYEFTITFTTSMDMVSFSGSVEGQKN